MIKSLKDLFDFYPLDFYAYFLLLLPVLTALYRREYLTSVLTLITLYFAVRFIQETIYLYYSLIPKPTQGIGNGMLILDVLLIGGFFFLSFSSNRLAKKLTIFIGGVAFLVTTANYLTGGSGSTSHASVRVMMIILSLLYFNKILAENRVRTIVSHSLFWTSAAFLFYGMGTFMTSLFKDYLLDPSVTSKATYDLFSDMNQMLSIILSILVAMGLITSKYDKDNYIQSV